jgi:hypothetical protein
MSTPFLLPIHDAPADYFRFTEQGLRSLLEGFRDVCVNSRNGYFESINVLRMRALVSPQGRTTIVMAVALYSTSVGSHVARFLDRRLGIKEGTTGYTISAIKPGD